MQILELFGKHPLDYMELDAIQRDLHKQVANNEKPNTLILAEVNSIYTAGSRTRDCDIPDKNIPLIKTDRGGSVTYHGPGQILAYPIVQIVGRQDVVAYVRALEEAVIATADYFGVEGFRVPGRTGVWVKGKSGDEKICAIGVRFANRCTMHGLALNISTDLSLFDRVIPCGILDAGVASFKSLGIDLTFIQVTEPLVANLKKSLSKFYNAEQTPVGTLFDQAKQSPTPGNAPAGGTSTGSLAQSTCTSSAQVTENQNKPASSGRKLIRIEIKNAKTPIEKKPAWIRTTHTQGEDYKKVNTLARAGGLHTVCQEAGCPNIYECWEDREATFLIGGSICTRRCGFCQIKTGKPQPLDTDEPRRVALSVKELGLRYATITGVARDDLFDGASRLFANTIRKIRQYNPQTGVEVLVDDFRRAKDGAKIVCDAKPEVFAHNIETVPRIFKTIRPAFDYNRSLAMLSFAKDQGMITKSNLILGMGEEIEEVHSALLDLRSAGVDIITLTQYLRPSKLHHPVARWIKPAEFLELSAFAKSIGFLGVMAGPLVRSSYRAGRLWAQCMRIKGFPIPQHLAHLEKEQPAKQEISTLLRSRPELGATVASVM